MRRQQDLPGVMQRHVNRCYYPDTDHVLIPDGYGVSESIYLSFKNHQGAKYTIIYFSCQL